MLEPSVPVDELSAFWKSRAEAAELRVNELEHCAQLLSCSASEVSGASELPAFLRDVLRGIATALRADFAHLTSLDAGRGVLRSAALIEDGVDVEHLLPSEMDISGCNFFSALRSPGSLHLHEICAMGKPPGYAWPGIMEYHQARGNRFMCATALRARNGAMLGHIGLAFRRDPSFSPEDVRLFQGFAQQAALAIELVQLAGESEQRAVEAAIAREQELAARQRSAELMKANRVLSRTVERVSEGVEVRRLVEEILAGISEVLAANAVALFDHDPHKATLHMRACVLEGQIADITSDARLANWCEPVRDDLTPFWSDLNCEKSFYFWSDQFRNDDRAWSFSRHWHEQMGHRSVYITPLRTPARVIGFLAIAFNHVQVPDSGRIELARALANQTALAIELTRLNEAAHETAIMREREKAAGLKAHAVSKLNTLLMESARRLADDDDPEQFLVYVAGELARVTGACWVFVFRYSSSDETVSLHLRWHNGHVRRGFSGEELPLFAGPFPSSITPLWQELRVRRDFSSLNAGSQIPESWMWPGFREWLQKEHIVDAVPGLLFVGDQPVGSVGLAFTGERKFKDADWGTVLTLTQQIALALRITALAERSREMAVAREQERAEQEKASAILAEREHLARELHDTLLQGFTGVALQLRALLRRPQAGLDEVRSSLTSIEAEATRSVQDARFAVTSMRSKRDSQKELVPALAALVQDLARNQPFMVRSEISGLPREVSEAVAGALLRITREAIVNAIRHGQATQIELQLRFAPKSVRLVIQDNGGGFIPNEQQAVRNGHFGLLGMRERAEGAGGRLEMSSVAGEGSSIVVEVPA